MNAPLGFTWVRVNGDPADGFSPGMYVDAAEVIAYLSRYEATDVAAALEKLIADHPPATTAGWVMG